MYSAAHRFIFENAPTLCDHDLYNDLLLDFKVILRVGERFELSV